MKPSIGRIVHYVLPTGPNRGVHRPAIILGVSGEVVELSVFVSQSDMLPNPTCTLAVHIDPANPEDSLMLDASWHWPERED